MPTLEQARQWYAGADPVHDFAHVLRVYRLAERIGQAEARQHYLAEYFERLAREVRGEA